MVSIKRKRIKNKSYEYAEYSFRLPDGKIKKLSKMIREKKDAKGQEVLDYFVGKEIEANKEFASKEYKPDTILPIERIKKIEESRIRYKHIMKRLSKPQIQDILDRFTINFTYESNAIEGNSLTLKDVTFILREDMIPSGKNLREIYETRNTRYANELLFDRKIKIDKEGIIKIHSVLMKDTGVKKGFKEVPNFLLMRNTKTTLPEDVEKEMDNLVRWYEKVKGKEHPLRIAADFHGEFERIHPFEDGNGRVGRMLINAILIDNDYPPLIIRKTSRIAYFSALEASDNGHKDKLRGFIFEKYLKTFDNFFMIYSKYANKVKT